MHHQTAIFITRPKCILPLSITVQTYIQCMYNINIYDITEINLTETTENYPQLVIILLCFLPADYNITKHN